MNNLAKHHGVGPPEARGPMHLHRLHRLRLAMAAVMLHIWNAIVFQFASHLVDFFFNFFQNIAKFTLRC